MSVQMAGQLKVQSRKRKRSVHVLRRALKVFGRTFRRVQELHFEPKMPPRCAQEAPSWTQETFNSAKLDPKCVQELQVDPKRCPSGDQEAPSWAQEAPKTLQVGPKKRTRASKLTPRGVQELQVAPKKASEKAARPPQLQSNSTATAKKPKPQFLMTVSHF